MTYKSTYISIAVLCLFVTSCSSNSKCNCSQDEMRVFISDLESLYDFTPDEKMVMCELKDDFWLVRLDSLDELDVEMGGYWDGLYDSKDPFKYIILPLNINKEDLSTIIPMIRKLRQNDLNLTFVKHIEDSTYSIEVCKSNKMERYIQQKYNISNREWLWLENKRIWNQEYSDFRIDDLK